MKTPPRVSFPQRKSLRLKHYDYSLEGMYFVTMCTEDRRCLFGHVVGAGPSAGPKVQFNEIGSMVESIWYQIPDHYPGVEIDEFIVMPNHLHGIIRLMPSDGRPQGAAPTFGLPGIIQRFKSLTTTRYRHGVKQSNWPPFSGRLWQRGYHDRIIRNESELNKIGQYIVDNPAKWEEDPEYSV